MACEAIQPSYFYATDSEAHISAGPDAKPSASLPGVPVFEPTMAQFADFYAFCQAIDAWGMQTGIVKIVPPREWIEALPSLRPDADPQHAHLGKVRIRHAITCLLYTSDAADE